MNIFIGYLFPTNEDDDCYSIPVEQLIDGQFVFMTWLDKVVIVKPNHHELRQGCGTTMMIPFAEARQATRLFIH